MHYFQFHIGDYRAATAHLSNEEDLAYRRLLDMYYDTEQPIPVETQWVARRIRVSEDVVKIVLQDMFFQAEDGRWGHARADQEIARYKALEERNRNNGSKGGRPKKPTGFPEDSQSEPTGKATNNQQPTTNNQETKKKAAVAAVVCPADVDQQVWVDFVAVRKAKKAPVTASAIAGIAVEAEKAGWTLDQALREITARGWQGFKASWVKETLSVAEQRLQTMHQLTGGITTPKNLPNFWDKPATNEAKEISDVERKRLL